MSLSAMQGASEAQTEPYIQYGEGAQELATLSACQEQQCKASFARLEVLRLIALHA
jgi:hypothetical protein